MNQFTNTNLQILFAAAQKLNLHPQIISFPTSALQISSKTKTHLITEKSFGLNSTKSINLSRHKSNTIKKLSQHHLPVPQQTIVNSVKEYLSVCQSAQWRIPQVIKPLTGQKGQLVFLNIKNVAAGQKAVIQILARYPKGCLIETYHPGLDYRFLVLNYKVIGLAQRLAPAITGNGHSTIKQLIDQENQTRHQQFLATGRRMLNRIRHWSRLEFNLNLRGLSSQAVLPQGKTIQLYPLPNFSTGGSATTIDPATIHSSIIKLAETAAKIIGLKICGVDMIIKSSQLLPIVQRVNTPCTSNSLQNLSGECQIIELNSDPGVRLHDWPNQGKPQHVAEKILKSIPVLTTNFRR
ncbi:MAG: hypothetical protein U0946_04035 [Patescibacteria group bacterium]|nr:hypothetical protein [Patescibacteria group bacterium]